ncbi:MAG: hypothetical protein ACPGGE_00560 [Poseidonia sp.]
MPRAAPAQVVEQRVTLGTYERNKLARLERLARVNAATLGVNRVLMPMAVAFSSTAGALALVGLGLGSNLDKERILDVIIGTPSIKRTRADGSEQEIANLFYGVPVLGPLFGTGMRIGEKSAEATTNLWTKTVEAVEEAEATLKENLKATLDDITQGVEDTEQTLKENLADTWEDIIGKRENRRQGGGGGGF